MCQWCGLIFADTAKRPSMVCRECYLTGYVAEQV